ncbi:MAG: iron-containing alcohol dehydrogenase [Candidatus Limnocylindrales bacterium]
MTPLHERDLELELRGRIKFGVGAVRALPKLVAAAGNAGGNRAFIITDPGVLSSGVIEQVRDVLAAAGIEVGVYAEVEPNPDTASIQRGSAALAAFGIPQTVIVAVGGGSSMDSAKAISLHSVNGGDVLALGYHLEDAIPGGPLIAIPTTAGTGAETNTYGVITDEAAGRKVYVGHPSVLPVWTILDPALTVGLPAGATAATGVDAMTHSLESLLSRNPNPFAEALALQVIRTVHEWLPRAVADGTDLEARSQMLVASHLAGIGQQSGTGVGLVHALGHAIGTRGRLAHGTALAVILPEVLAFYADEPGLRDRELALAGVALRAASPTEDPATGAIAVIGALRGFLAEVGLRPNLRSLGFDEALLDVVAQDAIDDAAIANSPRLPTLAEARAILGSVLD